MRLIEGRGKMLKKGQMKIKLGNIWNNKKKRIAIAIVLLVIAGIVGIIWKTRTASSKEKQQETRTATVSRMDITSSLSGSGTISPKDTYTITSMAEGEVIEADFEEGDTVEKGQVLYRIDASSMDSKLSSANNSVSRAEESYSTAVSDYSEAQSKYSGNTYKSTKAGYITKLYIARGDKVNSGTQIADIYNDKTMQIKIPFLNIEAAQITAGMSAVLTLSDTMEQLEGTVKSVSSLDETLTGGRLIRYVTIEVENPGGLTSSMAATAQIGSFYSSGDGTFEATVDTVLGADLSSAVEVEQLLVNEGSYVSEGTPIFQMTANTAQKLLKTYKDSVDQAQSGLESAQSSLDSTQDTYDNYTITAPISGTVITKSVKAGDKVQNGNSTTSLAVIYDMSSVSFQMDIDELDISNVKTGQSVEVTADAFEGKTFSGTVTNVSLEGSSSNGVTYYPVTVTLNEADGLLPVMNVDGTIILDSASQVLAVPADALQRGNQVYVKDDSVKEAQGRVPAGFRAVEVETGLVNTDYVEITSGDLNEGDEVYISSSSVGSSDAMNGMDGGMGGMPGGDFGGGAPGGNPGGSGGSGNGGNRGGSGGNGGNGGNRGGNGGFGG